MIDFILLFFLVVCAIAAVRMKDLLSAILILGAYSLIMAVIWTRLNAVDVAFTEAAVGAGITTVLLIAALSRTRRGEEDRIQSPQATRRGGNTACDELSRVEHETRKKKSGFWALPTFRQGQVGSGLSSHSSLSFIIVLVTGAVLVYGTMDMPDFGDPDAPTNLHVVPRYIEKAYEETGVVNFVTAVLASYRGYDTLGEVTVIFTAGVCVILLLRRKREQ